MPLEGAPTEQNESRLEETASLTPEQVEQMKKYLEEAEKSGLKEHRIPQELLDAQKGGSLTPEQVEQMKKYFEEAEKWGLKEQRLPEKEKSE